MENQLSKLEKEIREIDKDILTLLSKRVRIGTEAEAVRMKIIPKDIRQAAEVSRLERICKSGRIEGLDYYFTLAVFYTIFSCCKKSAFFHDILDDEGD